MSKVCAICSKGVRSGNTVARRGLSKKKGGAGRRILARSKRVFKPNLKKVRAIVDGSPKRIWVCARCIKSERVQKAP